MEPATPTTPARHGPCMTCRLRHVLCDRQRPCGRCARLGETDHCVDPPRAHKRGRPRKEPPPPPPTRAATTTAAPPLRPAARATTAEPVASSPPSLQAPTNAGSHQLREEGEEGHHGLDRQGAEGRGGPAPPLDTTLSLALLVELKKVRRECAAMAGKLDRMAKRQKLMQGQLDNLLPHGLESPSPSSSSSTSSSASSSSSTFSSLAPSRSFSPADWLEGVRPSPTAHFRLLSAQPSSNLLSCLSDRPWMIERVVPLSELRLPKHRFPAGSEQYLRPGQEMPATLVTGFNDQFCNLFKYSREELEELNGLRLYPRSVWEALTPLAEEVFCKCPTSAGPIYTFVAPMIDKQGGILYTECRWQGFYDWQGTISWGVSILDRWSESFVNHPEHHHHHQPALPQPAAQEEAAPASQPHHLHADPTPAHHHDPNSFLDHHHPPPTLDDLLYAHFFQDPPPT